MCFEEEVESVSLQKGAENAESATSMVAVFSSLPTTIRGNHPTSAEY